MCARSIVWPFLRKEHPVADCGREHMIPRLYNMHRFSPESRIALLTLVFRSFADVDAAGFFLLLGAFSLRASAAEGERDQLLGSLLHR